MNVPIFYPSFLVSSHCSEIHWMIVPLLLKLLHFTWGIALKKNKPRTAKTTTNQRDQLRKTVTKPTVDGVRAGHDSTVKARAGLGELSICPLISRQLQKNISVGLTRSRAYNRGGCMALGCRGRCWRWGWDVLHGHRHLCRGKRHWRGQAHHRAGVSLGLCLTKVVSLNFSCLEVTTVTPLTLWKCTFFLQVPRQGGTEVSQVIAIFKAYSPPRF